MNGPNGFLLESTKTWPATSTASDGEATFAYTYQTVQGFQLPSLVTVTASTSETWYYDLTDCKAMTGITLNVGRLGADCVQYPAVPTSTNSPLFGHLPKIDGSTLPDAF